MEALTIVAVVLGVAFLGLGLLVALIMTKE
jgi:hypothetical protein